MNIFKYGVQTAMFTSPRNHAPLRSANFDKKPPRRKLMAVAGGVRDIPGFFTSLPSVRRRVVIRGPQQRRRRPGMAGMLGKVLAYH